MQSSPTVRPNSWSRWRSLLATQLLGVTALWIGICLYAHLPSAWDWVDVLFFALLVFQCEMLGFWAGLGRSWRRFVLIVLGAPALGLMGSFAARGEVIEFQIFCLGVFGIVTLTTALLRWLAGSLQHVDEAVTSKDALQFGIQHVLVWTGVLAVMFGGFRYLFQLGVGSRGANGYLEILELAACTSFCTVASVWAILGRGMMLSRVAGMLLVTEFAVTLTHIVWQEWTFTSATIVSQVLLWTSFGLLRQAGYRFLKRVQSET